MQANDLFDLAHCLGIAFITLELDTQLADIIGSHHGKQLTHGIRGEHLQVTELAKGVLQQVFTGVIETSAELTAIEIELLAQGEDIGIQQHVFQAYQQMLATLLIFSATVIEDALHAIVAGRSVQTDKFFGLEVGAQVVEEGLVVVKTDEDLALILVAAENAGRFTILGGITLEIVDIQRGNHLDTQLALEATINDMAIQVTADGVVGFVERIAVLVAVAQPILVDHIGPAACSRRCW